MTNQPDKTVIYHNPHYSKSRQALKPLNKQVIEPGIIEYPEQAPDRNRPEHIFSLLHLTPCEPLWNGEDLYREPGLDDPEPGHDALLGTRLAEITLKLAGGII